MALIIACLFDTVGGVHQEKRALVLHVQLQQSDDFGGYAKRAECLAQVKSGAGWIGTLRRKRIQVVNLIRTSPMAVMSTKAIGQPTKGVFPNGILERLVQLDAIPHLIVA